MHLLKRPHDEPETAQSLPPPGVADERVDAPPPAVDEGPPSDLEAEDHGTDRGGRARLALFALAGLTIIVAIVVALFVVLRPTAELVVSSFEVPEVVLGGEPVLVEITVTNEGGADGERELTLLVDGAPAPTEFIEVAAGSSGSLGIPVAGLTSGTHEIALADAPETSGMVWVIDAPVIDLDEVVGSGDEARVDVSLANEGTIRVAHDLVLLVDGEPADSAPVELAPGEATTATIRTGGLEPGTHQLSLALADWTDDIGTVWVIEPPQVELDEVVVVGEVADVFVTLSNEGTVTVAHDLELLIDGTLAGSEAVRLAPGFEVVVIYSTEGLEPGTHQLSLALADWTDDIGTVWVIEPPQVTFPEVVGVVEGESDAARPTAAFDVVVGLGNVGPATVSSEVTLALTPGSWTQTRPIQLGAGVNTTITFAVSGVVPDTYRLTLTVGDLEESIGSVWVPNPARFELGDLTVSPNPIDINTSSELTVVATISNTGEVDGTYAAPLTVDGVLVHSRDIAIGGGQSVEEVFTVTLGGPGEHQVTLGDLSRSVTAHQLERPGNGSVLFNQIGGGSNRLRITNNRAVDVVVVLSAPGDGQPGLLGVYVRAESTATVRGIRNGTYAHYYVFGENWCTHQQAFTSGTSFGRFAFDGVYEASGSTYTQMDIEFGISEGVGSPTDRVPEDAFPSW